MFRDSKRKKVILMNNCIKIRLFNLSIRTFNPRAVITGSIGNIENIRAELGASLVMLAAIGDMNNHSKIIRE
jgi:hypothetical protein